MAYTPVYGPCCKIVVVKAFPYRAEALEEFSSGYTFSPVNTPTNSTQWDSFVENIKSHELPIYGNTVKWMRAYGYNSNDPHAAHVYSKDWEALGQTGAGTFVPGGTSVKGAGDQAAVAYWLMSAVSSSGKPIYFRKYLHEPWITSGGGDSLASEYVAAIGTYATYFRTYLGGPYSTKYPAATALLAGTLPYVTTRTLKRRGKRPRPSP